MFCHKCGKELSDDSKFCYECGTKVIKTTQSEIAPTSPYSQTTSVSSDNLPTQTVYQQQSYSPSQHMQPNQSAYVSTPAVKTKSKHKTLIIIIVLVLVAILIFPLFTGQSSTSGKTPSKDSSHDSSLIGKWRARNGHTIELNSDESAFTNIIDSANDILMFSKYFPSLKHTADNPVWESENGQLNFFVDHTESVYIEYGSNKLSGDYILLGGSSDGRKCYRKEGTESTNTYAGTWVLDLWQITLNEDGTGRIYCPSYEFLGTTIDGEEAFINWYTEEEDGKGLFSITKERLYIKYRMISTVDYYLSGNTLTVFLSNTSEDFIKIND